MSTISRFLQPGEIIDHTPAAAVYAGNILQVGALSGFASHDIAADALGSVAVSGVIRGPFVGGVVANKGDNIWWDADATPYGGAATGAFTHNAAAGDWWVGTLVAATSATGTTCDIALNKANPNLPAWRDKLHIATAVGITLTAADHSGSVVHVTGADQTITLPNGVAGMEFIVQNDVVDAGTKLIVDFTHVTEEFEGANLTILQTKTADLTKLTSVRGDFLHFRCCVATVSWVVIAKRGIWVTSA